MKCEYCDKEFTNAGGKVIHEWYCELNKNRKTTNPSGAKKGSIPWNKGQTTGRAPAWDNKYSIDKVLIENSTYPRHCLKRRIIKENLIEYKCACCGLGDTWNSNDLVLILDHINGINNDNRLENLRFVCPNCDSQLPTYKSRNIKYKKQ